MICNAADDIARMNGIVASEEEDEVQHEATGHAEREQEGSETDGDADDPTNAQETSGLASQTDELTGVRIRSPRLLSFTHLKKSNAYPHPHCVWLRLSRSKIRISLLPYYC